MWSGRRAPRIHRPPPGFDVSAASTFRDRCRRIGWAAGLPGLALILGLSAAWVTPRIESRLSGEASAIAAATALPGAEPWLRADAQGRDLVITGEAPDAATRDAAHERLARLDGVRRLVGPVGVVELASPFIWVATRGPDGVDLAGFRPAEIGASALGERLAPALEPGTALHDRTRAALGSPPDFPLAATYALARLRALAPASRVMLEDTRLSIIGEAASVSDEEALRAALVALPTGYSLGRVEILPASVPDFRFVVTRQPGGGVELSGYVVSEAARVAIRDQAAQIAEAGQVADRMRSARGLSAQIDAAAMPQFTLQIAGLLQEGSVTVADATVSASGIALDAQAIPEIEALLRDRLPAGLKRGAVALTTRPLSPYRIALRRDADSVTLTGHLPDAGTREMLLAALRPRLFRERLVDRTRLGQGAPADLTRALLASAGSLALMAKGEIRIADRSVTLTGESLYPQSARRIREEVTAAMPEGWSADVMVTSPGETPTRTPEACGTALDSVLKSPAPAFSPGSATLKPAFYPRLDAIAALARTCPALRLMVTGHSDPAGAAPTPKPTVETAVESTASLEADKPRSAKAPPDKPRTDKAPSTAPAAKPKSVKSETAKPEAKPAAPADPEPDLVQQRALAVVEYLLQAGLRPDQVAAAPAGTIRPASQGVGFALRS